MSFIEYSTFQIISIFATYLLAGTGKGITGLGFSTICLPLLALSVGLKDALPLVIIPSVCSNIMVMIGVGNFVPAVKRFWPMLLATVPGLILGLWLLDAFDGETAGAILGLVLLAFCLFSYVNPNYHLPAKLEAPLSPLSGFMTGTFNGITGSQVMPSMPFLMSLGLERNLFIQSINCSFTLSSFIMAFGLTQLGLFSTQALIISICGVAAAFFGVRLGERIRSRLSPEQFRNAILALLVVMAIILIIKAV